ncbi:MAG: amidohydrolase family protein [Lachnospiraceae bacterium]|uniref:amidohydrolase n=1 Tax=uncultured Acetatifactor sp. TaxID=1671927 RepID=UPI0026277839|nr:amidohydrolase family protein [uncultured Acetatifactor sp.]MCI8790295.1 amidohydrolase family protein [Lachnospiraceae bacterium]
MLCIKNGTVHDGVHREGFLADILVEDGKIKAIREHMEGGPSMEGRHSMEGKHSMEGRHSMEIPAGTEIVDAEGLQVYPGFVEAHGHIGLDGYGIGYEGMDYNELNDIISPQMRGIDGVKSMDPALPKAAAAGVTCVCVGPGSANVLGGTFTTIKTVGKRVDDMVVRDGVAMKCAFGENPKRVYRDKKDSSRMTTAALLRETLFKAREYMEKKEAAGDDVSKRPAFDMKLEAMIPVMKKEIPLKAHAHAAEDLFTALRIAREFDLKITLEHVTEGHLIVEELAKENVPLAVGPTLTSASKFELRNKSWITPGVLAAAGCQVSIITDSPVIPQEYLPLCAGLAVQAGMDPFAALQAITINPAKHAGIADRVGSLEVGKDADMVITDGCPFEVSTKVKHVFIDGKRVCTE